VKLPACLGIARYSITLLPDKPSRVNVNLLSILGSYTSKSFGKATSGVLTNFRRDKDGNVIVTRLNEQMCQEIAKAGNGMYIRVDNTNSAEKVLNNEIAKLSKADVESQVYTEFDEQFQALAWLVLILLVVEMLILERKNPLFKNVRLFK
jgi:predicted RNA-binding protein YlxR (DUF448 family)